MHYAAQLDLLRFAWCFIFALFSTLTQQTRGFTQVKSEIQWGLGIYVSHKIQYIEGIGTCTQRSRSQNWDQKASPCNGLVMGTWQRSQHSLQVIPLSYFVQNICSITMQWLVLKFLQVSVAYGASFGVLIKILCMIKI